MERTTTKAVLFHCNPLTTRKALAEPYRFVVWDHVQECRTPVSSGP